MMEEKQRLVILKKNHIVIDTVLLGYEFNSAIMLAAPDNIDEAGKRCIEIAEIIKRCQVTTFQGVCL